MDEEKDLPLPQKDLPLPQHDLPLPEEKLPPPHDMQLEAPHEQQLPQPHDMLLRAPTIWEKYPFLKWIVPLLLIVGIAVAGIMYITRVQEKKEPIKQKPISVQRPSPTKTLLQGNVYQSDIFGFTLEVPDNWKAVEEEQSVTFSPTYADTTYEGFTYPGYELRVFIEETTDTPREYWAKRVQEGTRTPGSTPITVAGIQGIRTQNNSLDSYEIRDHVSHNGKLYSIQQNYPLAAEYTVVKEKFPNAEKEFKEILSSFRFVTNNSITTTPDQIACTEEAMMCPDGSSVGRTGPNCEFAACP